MITATDKIYLVRLQERFGRLHPYFKEPNFLERYRTIVREAVAAEMMVPRWGAILSLIADGQPRTYIGWDEHATRETITDIERSALDRLEDYLSSQHGKARLDALYMAEIRQRQAPSEQFLISRIDDLESVLNSQSSAALEQGVDISRLFVSELGLQTRYRNQFNGAGLKQVSQLLDIYIDDVDQRLGIGKEGLRLVVNALAYQGVALAGMRPFSFPPRDEFLRMNIDFIFDRYAAKRLGKLEIVTVGQFSERLYDIIDSVGAAFGRDLQHVARYYGLMPNQAKQ